MDKNQQLYQKAKKYIPGGTQLLSKRPELFLPDYWPSYYTKAKGCEIWDLEGKKYIDMTTMGIGANILGYADPDVNEAVINVIQSGNMSSLLAPEEVELAELLCNLHPWANMVRYARTGGEAMAIAVRIARAYTKKEVILACGYHGWHDWYLSANLKAANALGDHLLPGLSPNGVPQSLSGSMYVFNYNDPTEFLKLAMEQKGKIAAVVIEAVRNYPPEKRFIEEIKGFCETEKIVFIVDEITSGWRMNVGGAHLVYDFVPDIAVFAKAISNGYPMAAILGKSSVMEIAQDSFISSTYWTEKIGPVAALATIKKLSRLDVPKRLVEIGKKIQEGWKHIAVKHGLKIDVSGIYPLSHFSFQYSQALEMKTLFTQLMLEEGFLSGTGLYSSYAHEEVHIDNYLSAFDKSFLQIAKAQSEGDIKKYLKGKVCQVGFKRLN